MFRNGYLELELKKPDNLTIRESVFARSFMLFNFGKKNIYSIALYEASAPREILVYNRQLSIRKLLKICHNDPLLRRHLMNLPISKKAHTLGGNDELIEPLQDLGNIVAIEATKSYTESYYPGVPEVKFVTEEHVTTVINAMQRELDREGLSRSKLPLELFSLPRERQRALVERRRYWFGKFGITEKEWGKNTFSLWKVTNDLLPELK
jgi:hypothetical protein